MQAMQYKILLPADYDMQIIKNRVKQNGYKMDGFKDLLFKAYLISEKGSDNLANSYCPLYVWQHTNGMTQFIFDGYFDNIIDTFGWQNINIGITANIKLEDNFLLSKYVLEEHHTIPVKAQLKNFNFKITEYQNQVGNVVIYNPDKWQYTSFTFFEQKPNNQHKNIHQILHLSSGL
ncbi:DUF4865 family protein [Gilliamella sp. B2776]|uniref:DUF4865 family protein n=1 Tax=unclassified Gilliamella TaxID=2685620 RepID=UPI00226A523B|nr:MULTISPECIES: DUF4865 family protein [unclassified Gilliamella]MCX8650727.1 DUF4865 family protein [Gilliamella sp. B2779]MCX8654344.1 DUF4865 family protein [Gilliamella sp. B2737]MCX8692575.1 DUF4865 family protein [Gilliamella sp. B2776]MCX8703729.1 DUF4865 family protein [Gilliamella sp. B2781]WDM18238.1 DUF4865 family protein [Gilliamella sp. B3022]